MKTNKFQSLIQSSCAILVISFYSIQAYAQSHSLLPGIKSSDLHNKEWPVTLHDSLLTGFSPLSCSMKTAPDFWSTFQTGGKATGAVFLEDDNQVPFFLLRDSHLRRFDFSGKEIWKHSAGNILFYEKIHGFTPSNGLNKTLGLQVGNTIQLINPVTGETYWQKTFEGTLGPDKIRLAKSILPNPGKQIFVFPKYSNRAFCFGFIKDQTEPELLWESDAGVKDWPIEADHGVSTIVDPDGEVVWNVRHHTINIHDVKTGQLLNRFEFKIQGEVKRNYGPSVLGTSADGKKLIGVIGQFVQNHISSFVRNGKEDPEPVFHKYIGEVYRSHGVQLWVPVDGPGDFDGDGDLDFVYSSRTVEPKIQTQTVICEAGTGEEKRLPDTWLAGITDLEENGRKTLFVYSDPQAEMSRQGILQVYQLGTNGNLVLKKEISDAELILRTPSNLEQPAEAAWCQMRMEKPVTIPVQNGSGLLIRDHNQNQIKLLSLEGHRFSLKPFDQIPFDCEILAVGKLLSSGEFPVIIQMPDGVVRCLFLSTNSENSQEDRTLTIPVYGGRALRGTAADITGDGACELFVTTPNGRMNVYTFDAAGQEKLLWSGLFLANETSNRLGPPIFDLNHDGQKNVVGFGKNKKGNPTVILYDPKGKVVWESDLPMPGSAGIVKWVTGKFFGPDHPGIFVCVQSGQTLEKSFMLDGMTGKIIWEAGSVLLDRGTRAMNPIGLPSVYDADGDGQDDLLLDYRDYMAVIRGSSGEFIQPPVNLGEKLNEWIAYNSLIPITTNGKQKPDYLVMTGFGGVGLFGNDFQTSHWYFDHDYQMPPKVGLVDVDADGKLEIGYEFNREGFFSCRDLGTGKEKWKLKLPGKGYGPVISADFDGDQKGEFLIGGHCIGTNAKGEGEFRWTINSPVSQWPVIADFDGDGTGEIAMTCSDGTVRIFKGK